MHTTPETIAIIPASATARCGSPAESGSTTVEDHGRERGVRSQDENAARTEQGVREQRHDGRVEAVDPG